MIPVVNMQSAFQRGELDRWCKPFTISRLQGGDGTDSWAGTPEPVILAQGGGFQPISGDFYPCQPGDIASVSWIA
jgi:hypothetical protein